MRKWWGVLSSTLLTLHIDHIMRRVMESDEKGGRVGTQAFTDLNFADGE